MSTSLTLYFSPGPRGTALLFLKQSVKHVLICYIQFNGGGVFSIFFFIVFMVVWFVLYALYYIQKLLSSIIVISF